MIRHYNEAFLTYIVQTPQKTKSTKNSIVNEQKENKVIQL